jgi:hypothetical protein
VTDFDFDRELARALRDSRDGASAGFTRRVLSDLERGSRRRGRAVAPLLAAAALLLVLAALPSLRRASLPGPESVQPQSERRAELLREYRALQRELEEIRSIVEQQQPVLYLGGDEDFDILYDLAAYPADGPVGGAQPAALPDRG